jgi:hypothetical protein
MKLLSSLIILFISISAHAQLPLEMFNPSGFGFEETKCIQSYVKEGPFSVSDASGMGLKTYENFRSKDNYKKKTNIIPKRSIVKIQKGSEDFVDAPNSYIPVEVIGVADSKFHNENLSKSRLASSSSKRQKLKEVNIGKKGFIYSKSLKKADKYTYILKEDSPLIADNGLSGMGVVAIQPETNSDGEFIVNQCCTYKSFAGLSLKPVCKNKYDFRLVYSDNTFGKSIELDVDACNVADSLMPFKNDEVIAMMNYITSANKGRTGFNLDKIEMLDEKGLVKIPLNYESYDGKGVRGPFGSYHYNADDKGSSDAYAAPLTGCAFMKVLEQHQQSCQGGGCQVQFGDIFHKTDWGPHKTHGKGTCIDIRPLKKTYSKSSLTYNSYNYDREKTKDFIELLRAAGGSPIVFDDRKIKNIKRSVKRNHANHIHVCFNPESKAVQQSCYQGIKKR